MRALGAVAGVVILACLNFVATSGQTSSEREVTGADYERWKTELSNWGRWGGDDELGALNLITPAKRRHAASLVTDGVSVSLARDMDTEEAVDNSTPFQQEFYRVGGDEWTIHFHGSGITHLDGLVHVFDDGKVYNGYAPTDEVMLTTGPARSSIHNLKNGIVTRGILMDIPRLKGVEYLEPGTSIYPADLEAWEEMAGVKVSAGDALFVRTGRWVRRAETGPWPIGERAAGLHASCIPWLKQRDIALLGGESPQDVAPTSGDLGSLPLHNFALIHLGVHLFDNVDLTAVSKVAAELGRWEFMLTVAPLAVHGGTGAPVNPIATF